MRGVVYVRVSTQRQVENLSLATQKDACAKYCVREGIKIARYFEERGESAKTPDRPEFNEMLAYCREAKVEVVVVYSLTRFSRQTHDHQVVRAYLSKFGVSLRSVTEPFDGSSSGKLMENILSSFAQFDNDVRAERTAAGLSAAKESGRWPHPAPLGYRNQVGVIEKNIEPDPEKAPLVKEAFRLMATGRFTQRQVLDQVHSLGLRTKAGNRLSPQSFGALLRKPIYAGIIVDAPTGRRFEGAFEGLVDPADFENTQAVLSGRRPSVRPYQRNNPEFPLRVFVRCTHCSTPLTGSRSTGRSKQYAYYSCRAKKAVCRARFNVRKEVLEERFVELLEQLVPERPYMNLFREIVLDTWRTRQTDARGLRRKLQRRIQDLETREEELVSAHLHKGNLPEDTYSRMMGKLHQELAEARLAVHDASGAELDVETMLGFAETLLLDAPKLWKTFDLGQKQRFQKILFPEGLSFDGGSFGTAATSPVFSYLRHLSANEEGVVARTGFEPVLPA